MIPNRLLPQQVTVKPYLGTGAYGDVYGDPVVYRARVETENQLIRSSTGEQVVANATVTLRPDADIPPDSKITLPGSSVERTVIAVSPHVAANAVHHLTAEV